jgi:predicted nucleic acid-binding protein
MTVRDITNKTYLRILSGIVDEGEASAIALYFEIKNSTLILDDMKARNLAKDLGIKYTGLMGVLVKAKQEKLIGAVKPVLFKLEANNFRISENLKHSILKLSKEI